VCQSVSNISVYISQLILINCVLGLLVRTQARGRQAGRLLLPLPMEIWNNQNRRKERNINLPSISLIINIKNIEHISFFILNTLRRPVKIIICEAFSGSQKLTFTVLFR
jgi:hypothetical protein